jgi:hypothetical protein
MVALGSDSSVRVRCFAFKVGSLKIESDCFVVFLKLKVDKVF